MDNIWQTLSFFSKKLSPAEARYIAFDRELLAVYATVRNFRHNLEGRDFFVNTDHKPLTYAMSSTTKRPSLRQTRHMAYIAEFTTDIRYVESKTNIVVDALSRPSVSAISSASVINYKDLREDQALDAEFTRLQHSPSSTFDNILVWCDVSTWHARLYITAEPLLALYHTGYSDSFKYLLICIDRIMRWPEAIPLVDIEAETVADVFFRCG